MDIYIGNLPLDTSVMDLRNLIGRHVENARYRIVHKTLSDGSSCCYGQISLSRDTNGEQILRDIQGMELDGRVLEIREFIHRNHVADRREPFWRGRPWQGLDRRKAERRRFR